MNDQAGRFHRDFKAMLPRLSAEMLGLSDAERRQFGQSKADRAFTLMKRGLVYLIREVMVDESPTLSDKIRFAHEVTRPEYLRDPSLGVREMSWLSTKPNGTKVAFALASDVFYTCRAAKDCSLNDGRFDPAPAPASSTDEAAAAAYAEDPVDPDFVNPLDEIAHH